jgi:hypothetical protein
MYTQQLLINRSIILHVFLALPFVFLQPTHEEIWDILYDHQSIRGKIAELNPNDKKCMNGTNLKSSLTAMFNEKRRALPKLSMLCTLVGEMHTHTKLPPQYKKRCNKILGRAKKLQKQSDLNEIVTSFANAPRRYFEANSGLFGSMVLSTTMNKILDGISAPPSRANLITPSSEIGARESFNGIDFLATNLGDSHPSPDSPRYSVANVQSTEGAEAITETGTERGTGGINQLVQALVASYPSPAHSVANVQSTEGAEAITETGTERGTGEINQLVQALVASHLSPAHSVTNVQSTEGAEAVTETGTERRTEAIRQTEMGLEMKGQIQITEEEGFKRGVRCLDHIWQIISSQNSVNSENLSALTSPSGTSSSRTSGSADRRKRKKDDDEYITQISNVMSQRDGGVSFMEILNKLFGDAKWISREDDFLCNARSLARSQVDHYLYLLVPSFVDQTLVRENYTFHVRDDIFVSVQIGGDKLEGS